MQLTPIQFKLIDRLSNSSDGVVLLSILEGLNNEISDIRRLDAGQATNEEIRARQIATTIIEEEVIDRLKIRSVETEVDPENFD